MLTRSFSSFLPSFRLHSLHPSHEVTNNEYRFYFNSMIKTIGLHRYLVKYIYSTLSHVVAVCFFFYPSFSRSLCCFRTALSVSLQGSVCSSANFTSVQDWTEQYARRHLVNSKPYSFFVVFFFT